MFYPRPERRFGIPYDLEEEEKSYPLKDKFDDSYIKYKYKKRKKIAIDR